jgi:hypothetical protein
MILKFNNNYFSKKAIQSIVLILLLIFIFIVIFVYVYSWFNYNLSSYQVNFELNSKKNFVYIGGFSNGDLILINPKKTFLELENIYIEDYSCNIFGNYTNEKILINLTQCINDSISYNSYKRVSLFFKDIILNKVIFFKQYNDCIQDNLLVVHGESNLFYNSSSSPCFNISRTCSNGVLNGSNNFNYSSCS